MIIVLPQNAAWKLIFSDAPMIKKKKKTGEEKRSMLAVVARAYAQTKIEHICVYAHGYSK